MTKIYFSVLLITKGLCVIIFMLSIIVVIIIIIIIIAAQDSPG
jgi:hypothetical protein